MKPPSRPPRTPAKLSDSLHHRLNMYALAASAAGVGMLALTQPAEGKIVYTPAHEKIDRDHLLLKLDLNHDGIVDFTLSYRYKCQTTGRNGRPAYSCYVYLGEVPGRWPHTFNNGAIVAGIKANRDPSVWDWPLAQGARVGQGANFKNWACGLLNIWTFPSTIVSGPWDNVKNRYLGLQFKVNGRTHYGWARLNVEVKGTTITGTVTGYAYETIPNKAIIAGKTKGPDVTTVQSDTAAGGLGSLALGRK